MPTVIAHGTTSKPKDVNCRELLPGKMNVKWAIVGEYVEIELNGRISEDQYMAFGISGKNGQPMMIGSDVVVAFYDKKQRRFRAEDYYISALSQCDGKHGVCPDERIGGKNDVEFGKFVGVVCDHGSLNYKEYFDLQFLVIAVMESQPSSIVDCCKRTNRSTIRPTRRIGRSR